MEDKKFSEMLMDGIVKNLIVNQVDQYGNARSNPIESAINKWIEQHRKEIFEEVSKKISVDTVAKNVVDKVLGMISQFGGTYSQYDRVGYQTKLNEAITKALAERIAAKMEIPKS
jgi:DNA replication initiation complex subunit (GINS family)